MARNPTGTFYERMAAGGRDSADLLEITLPLQEGETEADRVVIYVATRPLTVGGQAYLPKLVEPPEAGHSEGLSPDSTTGAIENASGLWGFTLSDAARTLDGAGVLVKKGVRNAAGAWEADTTLSGELGEVRIDGKHLRFRITPDLSADGAVVGDDEVGELPELPGGAGAVAGPTPPLGGYPEDVVPPARNDRRLFAGDGVFRPFLVPFEVA